MKATNIIEALEHPKLFGSLPAFRDLSTWARWLVFLKALYGLPLSAAEEPIFCQHTGRSRYVARPGGYREAAAITGRQAGKDRIGGAVQDYEAITAQPEEDGTEVFAASIAQDGRSALRTAHRYARAPFERIPALRQMVVAKTADSWTLNNGVVLAGYPCRPAALRGIRARVVILSELAFFRSSENLPVDTEMLRAVRPTLATTGGRLLVLSSPYGASGALYEMHRRHFGRDDSDVLIWVATAPEMNPTLPADYLQRMAQDDPEAYRSEVLGEFRSGVTTFLDPDALAACVDEGIRERAPQPGVRYTAFGDPSGGRRDAFTVAVAHNDGQRAVLDVVRAWTPPFNPESVLIEAAELLRRYGAFEIVTDRFGAEFVSAGFRRQGIFHRAADRDASALYLELQPLINSGGVSVLDEPKLLRELRGLERRRSSTGRDRVDHRPGAHDDRAIAAAGALVYASTKKRGLAVARITVDASWQDAVWGGRARPATVGEALAEQVRAGTEAFRLLRGGR